MERYMVIKNAHTRHCSALSFNYARRELVAGYEDGVIKGFEVDRTPGEEGELDCFWYPPDRTKAHSGMVNCLLYWHDGKLLLSAGNDGVIAAWNISGYCFGKVRLYQAVYSVAINPKKNHLYVGLYQGVRVFELIRDDSFRFLRQPSIYEVCDQRDIVKSIRYFDGRVYTASYDGTVCVYECPICSTLKVPDEKSSIQRARPATSYSRPNIRAYERQRKSISPSRAIVTSSGRFVPITPLVLLEKRPVHNAGITVMDVVRDHEGNILVFSGSFDKWIKIWNRDVKKLEREVDLTGVVSGLAYLPKLRSLWAVGGTSQVHMFEPKSGDRISDYISVVSREGDEVVADNMEELSNFQLMLGVPEVGCVFATTNDKDIIGWKYQANACVACLNSRAALEAVTFTKQNPILIFTGDQRGVVHKWERMEINLFKYIKEELKVHSSDYKTKTYRRPGAEMENPVVDSSGRLPRKKRSAYRPRTAVKRPELPKLAKRPSQSDIVSALSLDGKSSTEKLGIAQLLYVEDLDYVVAATENGSIYVFGFDPEACKALTDLQNKNKAEAQEEMKSKADGMKKFFEYVNVDTSQEDGDIDDPETAAMNKRVAGWSCLAILEEHVNCITGMAIVSQSEGFGSTYLISGGWDRALCVWNLDQFQLVYVGVAATIETSFKVSGVTHVSAGVINSLEYCSKLKRFAYGSSDGNAYIHDFNSRVKNLPLSSTLQGHSAEVTCIKWNFVLENWVTASEDGTIRIWDTSETEPQCVQILHCKRPITTLCIDQFNGCIVAGVEKLIKVYDVFDFTLIQSNFGHSDQIRSIAHLPEPRNHYISCSWDGTLRIWNPAVLTLKNRKLLADKLKKISDSENAKKD